LSFDVTRELPREKLEGKEEIENNLIKKHCYLNYKKSK
jgi:hypothetical protein